MPFDPSAPPLAITVLGFAAATFSTFAFAPQVWRTWRLKHADGVSVGMFAMHVTGIVLWFSYGVLRGDPPIVAANAIAFVLVSAQLLLVRRYRRRGAIAAAAARQPDV